MLTDRQISTLRQCFDQGIHPDLAAVTAGCSEGEARDVYWSAFCLYQIEESEREYSAAGLP